MTIGKIIKKGNYCRKRLASPLKFSKKSFRTKQLSENTKIIVACPRGKFKKKRCLVGTQAQAILKKSLKSGVCPSF